MTTEIAFAADRTPIAYECAGEGAPVVLIHGFGSDRRRNWRETGWTRALVGAGRRVIAVDCRGHGDSGKPHGVTGYRHDEMAGDIAAVIAGAGLGRVDVLGYSMGAFIALHLAAQHTGLVRRLAIGGIGERYLEPEDPAENAAERARVADAMAEADAAQIADPALRGFHAHVRGPGQDPLALAACWRAPSRNLPPEALARLAAPVLVVAGEHDHLGAPGPLAAAVADGRGVRLPGRDHRSAVQDPDFRRAVLDFLA